MTSVSSSGSDLLLFPPGKVGMPSPLCVSRNTQQVFHTDTFVAVYISLQSTLARKEEYLDHDPEKSTFASKLTLLHTKSG